tara:strand:+ start:119 stop:643 length:525 start_codon:yes stop_codon:yes gene_type:complete
MNLPIDSFIGSSFISKNLCDDILAWIDTVDGSERDDNIVQGKQYSLNKNPDLFNRYHEELAKSISKYMDKYPEVSLIDFNGGDEETFVQSYEPGQSYSQEHCERQKLAQAKRMGVFMTYLTDAEKGGTSFKYQKVTTPCKKGLTLLFPSDWTHTHKGEKSNQYKAIVTGWLNLQ